MFSIQKMPKKTQMKLNNLKNHVLQKFTFPIFDDQQITRLAFNTQCCPLKTKGMHAISFVVQNNMNSSKWFLPFRMDDIEKLSVSSIEQRR
jgi:hypothetical protein